MRAEQSGTRDYQEFVAWRRYARICPARAPPGGPHRLERSQRRSKSSSGVAPRADLMPSRARRPSFRSSCRGIDGRPTGGRSRTRRCRCHASVVPRIAVRNRHLRGNLPTSSSCVRLPARTTDGRGRGRRGCLQPGRTRAETNTGPVAMINWESPHDPLPCPHCGSTDTRITLQLLGLIRCVCHNCRRSFAAKDDSKGGPRRPEAAKPPS